METKFYYIHGLKQNPIPGPSKKFLELKKQYPNIELLEWSVDNNIELILTQWKNLILSNNYENNCIIASSTGANFAYQLRLICKQKFLHLVLINPLLNIDYVNIKTPENVSKYLVKITKLNGCLILIAKNDKIINHQKFLKDNSFINNNNHICYDFKSTHNFENLKLFYCPIDNLINNLYI